MRRRVRGFTYLWVLFAVAFVGVGLSQVAVVWSRSAHREKLAELDWAGAQFEQAIRSYYEATPGVLVKTFPPDLSALIEDRRYPYLVRHLRQVYVNPFTGRADWELVLADRGGIRGVRARVVEGSVVTMREYVTIQLTQ